MKSKKIEQENLCLQSKQLIDLLRTKLYQIDDFKDYDSWERKLKLLKRKVDSIYWNV